MEAAAAHMLIPTPCAPAAAGAPGSSISCISLEGAVGLSTHPNADGPPGMPLRVGAAPNTGATGTRGIMPGMPDTPGHAPDHAPDHASGIPGMPGTAASVWAMGTPAIGTTPPPTALPPASAANACAGIAPVLAATGGACAAAPVKAPGTSARERRRGRCRSARCGPIPSEPWRLRNALPFWRLQARIHTNVSTCMRMRGRRLTVRGYVSVHAIW